MAGAFVQHSPLSSDVHGMYADLSVNQGGKRCLILRGMGSTVGRGNPGDTVHGMADL